MPFSLPTPLPDDLRPVYVDPPHPSTLGEEQLLAQCRMLRGRTGGPGGQHRNKVETGVEYVHLPTGLSGRAGERRSSAENAKVALRRLRLELATRARVLAPPTMPSALWRSRCQNGRVALNPEHWDFPAMLAEALDHVLDCALDQRLASQRLECSASQLVRMIGDHPAALVWWNAARVARGMKPLRTT